MITLKNVSGMIKLYLNATLISTHMASPMPSFLPSDRIVIGQNDKFSVVMNSVEVYNRVIEESEVQDIMERTMLNWF